jgi:o-succinylbenzoate synthase
MKIKKVELTHVRLPLNEPFEISSGVIFEKDCIIVKLFTEESVGIGESSPMPAPFYSSETPETCIHILKDFIIPRLLGRNINSIADANDIFSDIRGNNFAKAGVETALWDLLSKHANKPLFEFIGGKNKEIPWKISIGIKPNIDELLASVEKFLEYGCKSIKIKIKKGWDIEPIKRIRERFGNIDLTVDANSNYTIEDTEIFEEIDNYKLTQIEQPLHYMDLYDHYVLQSRIETPICLDESIESLTSCKNALDIGSCRIINIKIQRVGGIKNALAIHDMCRSKGVPVWIGQMPESGVGSFFGLALCSLDNVLYASDIAPSAAYFKEDIINSGIQMDKLGNLLLSNEIGFGSILDEKQMARLKVINMRFGQT